MLFKWFVIGAIIAFLLVLISGMGLGSAIIGAIVGGFTGVSLRKWIFRTFWG